MSGREKDARTAPSSVGEVIEEMVTQEDVLGVVARAPHNWGSERRRWLSEAMAELGAAEDEVVAVAADAMASRDRNVRVKAVWVLSLYADPQATAAVVRALGDPVRRVREVALKAVRPHHVDSPEVWRAVQEIADAEDETNRLRQHAFFLLSESVVRDRLPEVAEATLRSLLDSDRYRASLLHRLCWSGRHTAASRDLLREFVRTGSKDEAVMATRALCGQRLMRVDGWLPADLRQRVRDRYDAAPDVHGGVPLCWIPAADADALAREVGQPHAP